MQKSTVLFLTVAEHILSVRLADGWGSAVLLGERPKENPCTTSRYSCIYCKHIVWEQLCDVGQKIYVVIFVRLCCIHYEECLMLWWLCGESYHQDVMRSLLMVFPDIVKHVVKEYRNIYPEIMKRAAHTFDQVCSVWENQRKHWQQLDLVLLKWQSQCCSFPLFKSGIRPQTGWNRRQKSHVHTDQ